MNQSMTRGIVLTAMSAMAVFVVGCGGLPHQQLDRAESALASARDAGAMRYSPEALASAEALWAETLAEVAHQQGRRAVTRTYRRAGRMADDVVQLASDAEQRALAAATALAEQAAAEIERAAAAVSSLAAAVEHVPMGRDVAEDSARMRRDLEELEAAVIEARQAFGAGDLELALSRAEGVETRAEAAVGSVEQILRHLVGVRSTAATRPESDLVPTDEASAGTAGTSEARGARPSTSRSKPQG